MDHDSQGHFDRRIGLPSISRNGVKLVRFLAFIAPIAISTVSAVAIDPPRIPTFDRQPGVYREYSIEEHYELDDHANLVIANRRVVAVKEYDRAGRLVVQAGELGSQPYNLSNGQIRYSYDGEGRMSRIIRPGVRDAITEYRYVRSRDEIPVGLQLAEEDLVSEIQWFDTTGKVLQISTISPYFKGKEDDTFIFSYEDGKLIKEEEYSSITTAKKARSKTYEYGADYTLSTELLYLGSGELFSTKITEWDAEGRVWREVSIFHTGVVNYCRIRKYAPDGSAAVRTFLDKGEINDFFRPDGSFRPGSYENMFLDSADYEVESNVEDTISDEWTDEYDVDLVFPTIYAVAHDRGEKRGGKLFVESRLLEYGFQVPHKGADWAPVGAVQLKVRDPGVPHNRGEERYVTMRLYAHSSSGSLPVIDMARLQKALSTYAIPNYVGSDGQTWAIERYVETELQKIIPRLTFVALRQ